MGNRGSSGYLWGIEKAQAVGPRNIERECRDVDRAWVAGHLQGRRELV